MKRKAIKYVYIDGFIIDATLTETHELKSEITMHPVEDGADITDHVRLLPIELTLNGVVSDTPMPTVEQIRGDVGSAAQLAHSKFLELRDNKKVITVETNLDVYRNMVMESVSIPKSVRNGDSLEFTAKFRQIELVTNERTTARIELPAAKGKKDLGTKGAKEQPQQEAKVLKFFGEPADRETKRALQRNKIQGQQ